MHIVYTHAFTDLLIGGVVDCSASTNPKKDVFRSSFGETWRNIAKNQRGLISSF